MPPNRLSFDEQSMNADVTEPSLQAEETAAYTTELDTLLPRTTQRNTTARNISWLTLFRNDSKILWNGRRPRRKWTYPLLAVLAVALLWIYVQTFFRRQKIIRCPSQSGIRLSNIVQPHAYVLDFTVDEDLSNFYGQANITIEIHQSSNNITFHAAGLNLTNVFLQHGTTEFRPANISFLVNDIVLLSFSTVIPPNNYTLGMMYNGTVGETMHGFYKSPYTNRKSGKLEYLAATHFEPIWARHALPCFDEPALKATFDITITIKEGLYAVSNMPVARIDDVNSAFEGATAHKYKRFQFEPTPPMSTYLAAWAIGDLAQISKKTARGVDMTVFVQSGREEEARYSLEVAVKALDYLEKLYGMPFPLPKLDLWPMPHFSGEAMENFGLMIFEDDLLMYNMSRSSAEEKQTTVLLVAHEIAHQWFGDVVTMAWWDDLWLNEGFAEFMQYEALMPIEQTWDLRSQFFYLEHMLALYADSSSFTHPIATEIQNPAKIGMLFDDVSYNKGAAVIAMLKFWMDITASQHGKTDAFMQGISRYLKRHQYATATTNDLWDDLNAAMPVVCQEANVIRHMMSSWVQQPGYPVVEIFPTNGIRVVQTPFTLWQEDDVDFSKEKHQVWMIPFTFQIISDEDIPAVTRSFVISEPSSVIPLNYNLTTMTVLANPNRTGFYRSQYAPEIYGTIADRLLKEPERFSASDRAGLVSDTVALMLSNRIAPSEAIRCLHFLRGERETTVWLVAVDSLNELSSYMSGHPAEKRLRRWNRWLVEDAIQFVGWNEGHLRNTVEGNKEHKQDLMRRKVLEFAIRAGHQPTIRQGLDYYKRIIRKLSNVPSEDLVDLVYTVAVNYGNGTAFEELMSAYINTPNSLPGNILHALATAYDTEKQLRVLELLLKPNLTTPEERISALEIMATSSSTSCIPIIPFLTTHYDNVRSRRVANVMERVIAGCNDEVILEFVRKDSKEREEKQRDGQVDVMLIAMNRGLERADAAQLFRKHRGNEVMESMHWMIGIY